MEDTEANNTDAGKSTLEPLLHEQFLEARGRKERRSEHTCSDQSLMSCAEKSLRLKPELRRQFWGSIFSPFLASAPWPSSVAGFRFLDSLEHSLERTYSAHKIPEGCPFARPCFGVPKSHGNQLRAKVPAQHRRFPPSATTMALPNNTLPKKHGCDNHTHTCSDSAKKTLRDCTVLPSRARILAEISGQPYTSSRGQNWAPKQRSKLDPPLKR